MGERSPVWDTQARGNIFGLSLNHTRAHVYRAFLEAVAYSLRHSMESTNTDLGDYILVAGGVAKSKLWRQIIADVTGYPIVCPLNDVEANLGDVILAGVGTGLLKYDDVRNWQIMDEKVMPNSEAHARYNQYYSLYRSIYTSLKEDMKKVSRLSKAE
jgi:xylulokinase